LCAESPAHVRPLHPAPPSRQHRLLARHDPFSKLACLASTANDEAFRYSIPGAEDLGHNAHPFVVGSAPLVDAAGEQDERSRPVYWWATVRKTLTVQPSEVTDVLSRPIGQELLDRDLTRLAYIPEDGTPRSTRSGSSGTVRRS
jgi:hypothetical protein